MKTFLTTKEIATKLGRSPVTISSTLNRLGIVPCKTESSGSIKKHYYNLYKSKKIFDYYESMDNSRIMRRKTSLLFPEVIYVTRTIETYESRLNYTPLNKL